MKKKTIHVLNVVVLATTFVCSFSELALSSDEDDGPYTAQTEIILAQPDGGIQLTKLDKIDGLEKYDNCFALTEQKAVSLLGLNVNARVNTSCVARGAEVVWGITCVTHENSTEMLCGSLIQGGIPGWTNDLNWSNKYDYLAPVLGLDD